MHDSGVLGDIREYAFVLLHIERAHFLRTGITFRTNDGLDDKARKVFESVLVFHSIVTPLTKKLARQIGKIHPHHAGARHALPGKTQREVSTLYEWCSTTAWEEEINKEDSKIGC